MKLGKILHLGIMVEDIEKAAAIYEEKLGIGPWEFRKENEVFKKFEVNGKPGLNIRTALFRGDGYELELVQPTGEGIYADWLKEHGPGMHHIKFASEDDFDTIMADAREISGGEPWMQARIPNGPTLFGFADLQKDCGLLLEVNSGAPQKI